MEKLGVSFTLWVCSVMCDCLVSSNVARFKFCVCQNKSHERTLQRFSLITCPLKINNLEIY